MWILGTGAVKMEIDSGLNISEKEYATLSPKARLIVDAIREMEKQGVHHDS